MIDLDDPTIAGPDWLKTVGSLTASAEFANPWHDQIGRFAPKGTGRRFDAGQTADSVIDGQGVTVAAEDVDEVLLEFADEDQAVDLTLITIRDSHLFSSMREHGMPRSRMPQIPKDQVAAFQEQLREAGIGFEPDRIDPRVLKPTQSELDGRKTGQILRRIRTGDYDYDREALWVSSDDHVLDGHHRWAATAAESHDCGGCIDVPIVRVDLPMSELLVFANGFVDRQGIERTGFDDPGDVPYRRRVAAAVQNEGMEEPVLTMATDADDGITDDDLADLPHGDGTAFADTIIAAAAWRFDPLAEFGNPWHDAIGRFAPKGVGRRFDSAGAELAYREGVGARDAAQAALDEPYDVFYTDHGTIERDLTFREAIDDYTQYGSSNVNRTLRSMGVDTVRDEYHRAMLNDAVALDEAIVRGGFVFPEDTAMLRGFSRTSRIDFEPGTTFTDPGFVSATASAGWAEQVAGDGGTVVELNIPAGTRGLAALDSFEQEVILPRNATFTVTGVEDVDGVRYATVDVAVPDAPPQTPGIMTIEDRLARVADQANTRAELERERGIAASPISEPDPKALLWERLTWDDDAVGALVASAGEFANPWHDENGRFAPKGMGTTAPGGLPDSEISDAGGGTVPAEGGTIAGEATTLGMGVPLPSRQELLNAFDPVPETPEVESTLLEHMDENGNLTPARQAVHDRLIAEALEGIQPGNPKRALVMGGGAASGKSTAIREGFVTSPEGALTINPDDFKVKIPETEGPAADGRQGNGAADRLGAAWAAYAHEESSFLGKRLHAAATEQGLNIVLDKTSSNGAKAVREIRELRDQGYEVEVAFVTTDIDIAVANAAKRGAKIGREVPIPVLRKGHEGANQAFLDVAAEAGVATKLVTTHPARPDGSIPPPVLTASTDGSGRLVVHDRAAWDQYTSRVKVIPESVRIEYEDEMRRAAAVTGRQFRLVGFADSGGTADVATGAYNEAVTTDSVDGAPGSYDDKRMQVLMSAAKGKEIPDLTDDERTFVEELRVDLDRIEQSGNAFDVPISSVI